LSTTLASIAPLNNTLLRVSGKDAEQFLQGLVTNDVTELPCFASLLNSKGRWLYSFFITKHKDALLLECSNGDGEGLKEILTRYILGAEVTIEPLKTTKVWGLWNSPPLEPPIFADPRIKNLARCYGEIDTSKFNLRNTEDYLGRCFELGLTFGEPELQRGKSIILEYGFHHQNGISWNKGCYLGQEVMAHIKNRSAPKRALLLSSNLEPPTVDGKIVGEIIATRNNKAMALVETNFVNTILKNKTYHQPPFLLE